MIIVDSDILLLAFAFHDDSRQAANSMFLEQVQRVQPATTIYNLMEILGQLSFNLAPEQLDAWQSWLIDAYQLTVIWPLDPDDPIGTISFREEIMERPLAKMRTYRMPFLDTLIINLAERTPDAQAFLTWNARHFRGKKSLDVFTPEDYMAKAV